ncbi:hypothetical protein XENOCAPTIV_004137 [Xenoophorus captivus]|uniref:Uncharacterized protein n=1 Tax=Xenoophorus captivus TaxID=1517983 RepID=A0ABV0Q7Y2_9TELE
MEVTTGREEGSLLTHQKQSLGWKHFSPGILKQLAKAEGRVHNKIYVTATTDSLSRESTARPPSRWVLLVNIKFVKQENAFFYKIINCTRTILSELKCSITAAIRLCNSFFSAKQHVFVGKQTADGHLGFEWCVRCPQKKILTATLL